MIKKGSDIKNLLLNLLLLASLVNAQLNATDNPYIKEFDNKINHKNIKYKKKLLYDAEKYREIAIKEYEEGHSSNSIKYFEKSLSINQSILGNKDTKTLRSYLELGWAYNSIGNHANSIQYLKKVINNSKKESQGSISTYCTLSLAYNSIGDPKNALHFAKQALVVSERILKEKSIEKSNVYNVVSTVYRDMEKNDKAIKYLKKALVISERVFEKGDKHTAGIYSNLSIIYAYKENYAIALEYAQVSLKILKGLIGDHSIQLGENYNNIGLIYLYIGNYNKALEYSKKSLAIKERILGIEHISTAATYDTMGNTYKKMGNYKKAYHYTKKSYDIFLSNRDKNFNILSDQQKKLYLESNNNHIPLLLETAYLCSNETNQSKIADKTALFQITLNDWLNYKGSILDSENSISTLYEQTKDPKVKETIEELRDKKMYLAKLSQQYPTAEQAKAHQENVNQTKDKIDELERNLSSKVESFKEEINLRVLTLENVTKYLKPNELYIDYAKAEDNYYLFTLNNKKEVTFSQIDTNDTKTIEEGIKEFRDQTKYMSANLSKLKDKEIQALKKSSLINLSKLYTLLIDKPVGDIIKSYDSLVISPDGALNLMPFESLYNEQNGHYFIEDKAIRYIPSGKEFVRLNRRDKQTKSDVVVFANPNYDTGYNLKKTPSTHSNQLALNTPNTRSATMMRALSKMQLFRPLPGTEREAQQIKMLLKGKGTIIYDHDKATEENLMGVHQPKILHISTHGFFINDKTILNPMLKSGIVLSGANTSILKQQSNGVVTALKLSGLNLQGTELVMLSACETGVSDIRSGGEGVSGLNKAFLQAGASDVAMTLWSVADNETAELVEMLYSSIKNGKGYSEALRDAKLNFIKEKRHPYFWAGFITSGK